MTYTFDVLTEHYGWVSERCSSFMVAVARVDQAHINNPAGSFRVTDLWGDVVYHSDEIHDGVVECDSIAVVRAFGEPLPRWQEVGF